MFGECRFQPVLDLVRKSARPAHALVQRDGLPGSLAHDAALATGGEVPFDLDGVPGLSSVQVIAEAGDQLAAVQHGVSGQPLPPSYESAAPSSSPTSGGF